MGFMIPLKDLFYPLRSSHSHSKLGISPNNLNLFSIAIIICLFILRTIKHAIGLGTPFTPSNSQDETSKRSDQVRKQFFNLPNLSLSMPLELKPTDLNNYITAVKSPIVKNELGRHFKFTNAHICLYLAALSEPAMLLMLAKRGCPIRPLGAVNVRNRFEMLKPDVCRELCRQASNTSDATARSTFSETLRFSVLARFPGSALRVRRGIEIDVEVCIVLYTIGNSREDVAGSRSEIIFRQVFTMLQFMKFSGKSPLPDNEAKKPNSRQTFSEFGETTDTISSISMGNKAPRLWAKLCKDYNPIHFSPLLAKLLGQPGQLAHGNHAVGVCIERMYDLSNYDAQHLDDSGTKPSDSAETVERLLNNMEEDFRDNKVWWMEVRFRRPIVLPALIGVRSDAPGNGFDVVDCKSEKTTVEVNIGTG